MLKKTPAFKKALIQASISTVVALLMGIAAYGSPNFIFLISVVVILQTLSIVFIVRKFYENLLNTEVEEEISIEDLIELQNEVEEVLEELEDADLVYYCDDCSSYHPSGGEEHSASEDEALQAKATDVLFEEIAANGEGGYAPVRSSKIWRGLAILAAVLSVASIFVVWGVAYGSVAGVLAFLALITAFNSMDVRKAQRDAMVEMAVTDLHQESNKDLKSYTQSSTTPKPLVLSLEEEQAWKEILHSLKDIE